MSHQSHTLFLITLARLTLGLMQPALQWVKGTLTPWVKRPGHEADHLQLVPMLRMRGTMTLLPSTSSWPSAWLSAGIKLLSLILNTDHNKFLICFHHPTFNVLLLQYKYSLFNILNPCSSRSLRVQVSHTYMARGRTIVGLFYIY